MLDMYEWLFAPPGSKPSSWDRGHASKALLAAIEGDDSTVFVDERGGGLAGFCTAYIDLDSVRFGVRCWVEDLAVDPSSRSEGIGARLLAAAREWAAGRGATHLELDSSEARRDAHRFYEREGGGNRSISFTWELDR